MEVNKLLQSEFSFQNSHQYVYKTVDQPHEHRVTASNIFHADPGQCHHPSVVVDMQKGNVSLLLLQHKEHRIKEINDLREEVIVRHFRDLHLVEVLRGIIDGLTEPTVALSETVVIALDKNERAHCDLKEIVAFYDGVQFVRLAVLHVFWTPVEHKVEVDCNDRNGLKRI